MSTILPYHRRKSKQYFLFTLNSAQIPRTQFVDGLGKQVLGYVLSRANSGLTHPLTLTILGFLHTPPALCCPRTFAQALLSHEILLSPSWSLLKTFLCLSGQAPPLISHLPFRPHNDHRWPFSLSLFLTRRSPPWGQKLHLFCSQLFSQDPVQCLTLKGH